MFKALCIKALNVNHIGFTLVYRVHTRQKGSTELLTKMLEKELESYFIDGLKEIGCLVFKFVSPGNAGVPDRIVISKTGSVYFVELKRPGGKVRRLQEICIRRLREHKVWAGVISTRPEVDKFCQMVYEADLGILQRGNKNEL